MTSAQSPPPDQLPATGDPGDETARRYRYQWTYAAIVCCTTLDDTQGVIEVFCEHHEDVLIKHADESFSGLQIKTRAPDQDLWRTTDEGVRTAFARFAHLEAVFPGRFREFVFLTNHPLYSAANGRSIRHTLSQFRAANSAADLPSPAAKFLQHIATAANCPTAVALTAMRKTSARDDLPKLTDAEVRLVSTLTVVWERATDCSHAAVVRAARSLINECQQASSLAHEDALPAYLPVTANVLGAELAARIDGKRIDRSRVLAALENGLNQAVPLHGSPTNWIEPGTGTTDLLVKKLDAGGFSSVSQNSDIDLRDKADYLGIVWTKKHGRESGLQRYGHIRSLVLKDAGQAFETSKNPASLFGLSMLAELRSYFRKRRTDGSQLYECTIEHLEGFAYSMTSQCTIQWSLDRPWESD